MKTVSAKVSDEEYQTIKRTAINNNMTISSLIKQSLFDAEIRDNKSDKNLALQLNKIGNNLNQITRYCHTKSKIDGTAKSALEEIRDRLNEIIDDK